LENCLPCKGAQKALSMIPHPDTICAPWQGCYRPTNSGSLVVRWATPRITPVCSGADSSTGSGCMR
jgi:hypothetical protein